jgi:hypothetical protein
MIKLTLQSRLSKWGEEQSANIKYTTMSFHITSRHISPHHITSHHLAVHPVTSHHLTSHHMSQLMRYFLFTFLKQNEGYCDHVDTKH